MTSQFFHRLVVPDSPGGISAGPELFQVLLVAQGVHRVPEPVVRERRKLAGRSDAHALAQQEIDHLMQQGYQEHEAEEVALPLFILLPPETGGGPTGIPELDQELADREAAYQKMMREPEDED